MREQKPSKQKIKGVGRGARDHVPMELEMSLVDVFLDDSLGDYVALDLDDLLELAGTRAPLGPDLQGPRGRPALDDGVDAVHHVRQRQPELRLSEYPHVHDLVHARMVQLGYSGDVFPRYQLWGCGVDVCIVVSASLGISYRHLERGFEGLRSFEALFWPRYERVCS